MKLSLEKKHLDLKVVWKLSRNQTSFKENFIVHLHTMSGDFRSEIAPNIRYGETPELIEKQFNEWIEKNDITKITNLAMLAVDLDQTKLFHSLRFGLDIQKKIHFRLKLGVA